jgi:glycerol-3-phosphate O-acyltransferase
MPEALPLRVARPVSGFFAAPVVWPDGVEPRIPEGPCIYIAPLETRTDERVVRASLARAGLPAPRWIASRRGRVDMERLRAGFLAGEPVLVPLAAPRSGPDRLARLLAWADRADIDVTLVPVEALWGPEGGSPPFWNVLFGNPFDPPNWCRAMWGSVARLRGALRVIVGRPGTRRALQAQSANPEDALALSAYVRGQAVKALSVPERQVLGDRYKVPRLVADQIMQEPAFRNGVAAEGATLGLTRAESLQRAAGALRELATGHNLLYMELFRRFTRFCYTRVYDSEIDVQQEQLEKLRELGKRSALVFIPSHKSNFDHLILYYLFFSHGFPPPHTAAGSNMSFFPMSRILPGTGAYFIRRSFQDDPVYKECLRSFITYLVQRRFHQEFFIEGGRTRSGKQLPPRYGMLRYIVEGVRRTDVDDVQFVPTAITYDQILEVGEYVRQEQGEPKERESLGFLVRMVRSLRGRDFGRVYIRFGDPIALCDHLEERGDDALIVEKLAFRIANEINAQTRLTAVSIVCSALLSAGRQALTLEELTTQIQRTLEYAGERRISLSRELMQGAKTTLDAASRALRDAGVLNVYEDGVEPVYSIPAESRSFAAYYRNSVIHFFLVRAIARLAFSAAAETRDAAAAETRDPAAGEAGDPAEVWALRLREVLKFEFFFRDREEFLREVELELGSLAQEARAGIEPIAAAGPGILIDYLESYRVVTDALGSLSQTHNYMSEDEFLKHCHGVGRQLLLQEKVGAPELLSNSNFRNALRLATNLGAAEHSDKGYRRGDSAALGRLAEDLQRLSRLAR